MAIVANVGPAPITGHISGHVITLATFGNQPSITLDPWCPLSVETRFLERNGCLIKGTIPYHGSLRCFSGFF